MIHVLIQATRSRAADEWFFNVSTRVHPVLERRSFSDDEKVRVAILDTGIDASHSVFSGCAFDENNCHDWTNSNDPTVDIVGHGTHSAALVLKVAPNASLYIAKVFDSAIGIAETPKNVAKVGTKRMKYIFLH